MEENKRTQTLRSILKVLLLISISIGILVPGFYRNNWLAAGKKRFVEWQRLSDAPVVGRLVQSRQAGIFSYGGLLGSGDKPSLDASGMVYVDHQYEVYENNGKFSQYLPYPSVIGLQGAIFSAFDSLTNFEPGYKLKIFRGSASVLSAAALSLIILWFYTEFGLLAALFSLAFMMTSEWLTYFGGSMYWSLWAFYLPFISLGGYLWNSHQKGNQAKVPATLLAVTILNKCLFNGFEFISTTLLMVYSPIIYYALVEKWSGRSLTMFSLKTAFFTLLGASIAFVILLAQGAIAEGGWGQAIQYLLYTIGKRSLGNSNNYTGLIAESLKANTISVIWTYLSGRSSILSIGDLVPLQESPLPKTLEISFLSIIVTFLMFTVFFLATRRRTAVASSDDAKIVSLITTTWISILAPLSWFIVFKAHAYIHTQLDFVVWQMPFTLLGCGMCGAIVKNTVAAGRQKRQ